MKQEIRTMSKTYGEVMYEKIKAEVEAKSEAKGRIEGEARGEQRGKAEGTTLGRILALRQTILRHGRRHFGEATNTVIRNLEAIDDTDRLERIDEAKYDVHSWEELLAVP